MDPLVEITSVETPKPATVEAPRPLEFTTKSSGTVMVPVAPSEPTPATPFRHSTCSCGCGKAIADTDGAIVYPYVDQSFLSGHEPETAPPMPEPPAEEPTEA
jgi:hypothetical protein